MVSIFTVYDRAEKGLRYMIANDEGFNWQTMDTVGHEPQEDLDYDEITLGTFDWSALTTEPSFDQHQFTDEEWELFKHCQFEFYKEYCSYFKSPIELTIEDLPIDLLNKLTPEAIEWHRKNEASILTDGYSVACNDLYDPMNVGLKENVWTSYLRGDDRTIVWKTLYLDGDIIQESLVGWYFGEPSDETTKEFSCDNCVARMY